MSFKKLLTGAAIALGLMFFAQRADATCSNYTTYVDGQVLTAGSLNSLQTNYTNCVNAVLDGDTFTGTMSYYSGADINVYSDTGSTLKAQIDGATGDVIMSPRTYGFASNCEINYSSGTITISGRGGAALSATNPCHVGMKSNTNGVVATATFTANVTTTDGATSDTDGNLFGITDANWANAMPIFFGVIYDGTTPYFGFSRKPLVVSGSAATDLCQEADTDCDGENDFFIMTTGLTLANWVNLPITPVAWLTATYATTGGAWTFAETTHTGFNDSYQTIWFTYPQAQYGAAASSHLRANGGTVPAFTTNTYTYRVFPNLTSTIEFLLDADAGTDGSGAVTAQFTLPFTNRSVGANFSLGANVYETLPAATNMIAAIASNGDPFFFLVTEDGTTRQLADYSNGSRRETASFTFSIY